MTRIRTIITMAIVAAIAATTLVLPSSASALAVNCYLPEGCPQPARQKINIYGDYKGWAYVGQPSDNCGSGGMLCASRLYTAYRWTGSQWVARYMMRDTQIYAYPYGSGWQWVWTQNTGWLAMRTSDIYIYGAINYLAVGA